MLRVRKQEWNKKKRKKREQLKNSNSIMKDKLRKEMIIIIKKISTSTNLMREVGKREMNLKKRMMMKLKIKRNLKTKIKISISRRKERIMEQMKKVKKNLKIKRKRTMKMKQKRKELSVKTKNILKCKITKNTKMKTMNKIRNKDLTRMTSQINKLIQKISKIRT